MSAGEGNDIDTTAESIAEVCEMIALHAGILSEAQGRL
jgi:hypothetical protein